MDPNFFFEQDDLDALNAILNNKQIDNNNVLKTLTKLVFSLFNHAFQFPPLFSEIKTQMNDINEQLQMHNEILQNIQNQQNIANNNIQIVQYQHERQQQALDTIDQIESKLTKGLNEINKSFNVIRNQINISNDQMQNQSINYMGAPPFQSISSMPVDLEQNIFIACSQGKLSSVQWLVEKENVDVLKKVVSTNFKEGIWQGNTPIHIAGKKGQLPIVQYLVEKHNVDVNVKGRSDRTPLHEACINGHFQIVEYLLSKGADIEAKDMYGYTPLLLAVINNHANIAAHLIINGANKNAVDNEGRSSINLTENDDIRNLFN